MPSRSPEPLGREQAIGSVEAALTRLRRTGARLRAPGGDAALPARLERAAYDVLARLAELAPIRLTELADALALDISTASRHVRALEARELIERHGDPDDHRSRMLAPSAAGTALLREVRTRRCAELAERLADWSADDLGRLGALLGRFVDSYDRDAELLAAQSSVQGP